MLFRAILLSASVLALAPALCACQNVTIKSDIDWSGQDEPASVPADDPDLSRPAQEPTLAEKSEFAIGPLSEDDDGCYLRVEPGRVDHAHHGANAARTLVDEGE